MKLQEKINEVKMEENNLGWIKIYRKIMKKKWYKKSNYKSVWLHILLSAIHKEKKVFFNGIYIQLKEGQFITGRKKLSNELGIDEYKIERILNFLEKKEHQITQQKTTKNRLILISKWETYQKSAQQNRKKCTTKIEKVHNKTEKSAQQKNSVNCLILEGKAKQSKQSAQQKQKKCTTKMKKVHNKNEKSAHINKKKCLKKERKNILLTENIRKNTFHFFGDFVKITKTEYTKLITKFGKEQTTWMLNKLDNYIGSKGKDPYNNHYRTILSWVVDAYEQKHHTQKKAGDLSDLIPDDAFVDDDYDYSDEDENLVSNDSVESKKEE